MSKERHRIIVRIENYKSMAEKFRKNGNEAKATEYEEKVMELQNGLLLMSATGISPRFTEQLEKRKFWSMVRRTVGFLILVAICISFITTTYENITLKQQVRDLTALITAERYEKDTRGEQ